MEIKLTNHQPKLIFLIQTVNGKITHDFIETLSKACEYQDWLYNTENSYLFIKEELENISAYPNYKDIVPIGSVEFVHKFMEKNGIAIPKPLNIPKRIQNDRFLKRGVYNDLKVDQLQDYLFTKSMDIVKFPVSIYKKGFSILPEGNYMQSDPIDIDSEYRCFVYRNKLVGIQNYSGDFTLFPDIRLVEDAIYEYSTFAPTAYTLDVGINKHGTFIIELHNFYSVGLYGFKDYKILIYMYRDWYQEYIRKNLIEPK